jgi:hypothetical protein
MVKLQGKLLVASLRFVTHYWIIGLAIKGSAITFVFINKYENIMF